MKKFIAELVFPVSSPPIQNGIVICDELGKIVELGSSEDLSTDGALRLSGSIIPGFVNTHCHLELSHMKGLIDTGTGLLDFIGRVVKYRDFPEEVVKDAIEKGDLEMWEQGIMAVGDISNKADTATVKNSSNIDYYTFVEMFEFMQESLLQPTIDQYKLVYDKQSSEGFNKKSYVPHAPYSVGPALFDFINKENKIGSTISIHNQETVAENQLFLKGKGDFYSFYQNFGMELPFTGNGKTAIHYALQNMDSSQKTLFVHNTLTTLEDIEAAQNWNSKVYWATCPNANLYIENRLPDYRNFIEADAKMTIGTDSLTSNWQLSIFEEMKAIAKYKSYISFEDLLKWATLNGAEALSYDDRLGSLEVGKSPGILHLDAPLVEDIPQIQHGIIHRLV